MEAVSSTDTSQSRSECVQFTALESDDKKGVYKFNVKLIKAADDILIRPVCQELPYVAEVSPKLESSGCNQDTTITISFNKEMDPSTFMDAEGKIAGIFIASEDGEDLTSYFADPVFVSDSDTNTKNKLLRIMPLCLTDDTKFILSPDGTRNVLNIKVSYAFVDAKDADGLSLTASGSHEYRINKNFTEEKDVTVSIQNENTDYGSFFSPGDKSCIVGFSFDVQFTLNKDTYVFEGFEAVGKDGTSRSDCVSFENVKYDVETGICSATVTVIQSNNDIIIRPKCKMLANKDVYIDGTNGKLSPSRGLQEKRLQNREYTIGFDPDTDYEFLYWQIFDKSSGTDIPNGTYITITEPSTGDTSYTLTTIPEDDSIQLALRPVVAERPHILSNSPLYTDEGVNKDTTIQVVFDYDMSENSIYYTEQELDDLKENFGEESLLPPVTINGEKKYYGYKIQKDSSGEYDYFYKNISIKDNDTGENLNKYFNPPRFDNKRTLSIFAMKDENSLSPLIDYSQIVVTLEKDFFYKADNLTDEGKNVCMSGIKKWIYMINDATDTAAPVIATETDVKVSLMNTIVNGEDMGTVEIEASDTAPSTESKAPVQDLKYIRDKKVKLNIKSTDTGSGTSSTFGIVLQKIYDGDYNKVTEDFIDSKAVKYKKITKQNGIYSDDNGIDLGSLFEIQDGIYKMTFEFKDRGGNTLSYPDGKAYYFAVDKTAPEISTPTVSSTDSTTYKLDWSDYYDLIASEIIYGEEGSSLTSSGSIAKGTFSGNIENIRAGNKYVVKIKVKDYAGNESEKAVPPFMTGLEVEGSPSSIALVKSDWASNYGLTVTATYYDGSSKTVSDSAVIVTEPRGLTTGNAVFSFTEGDISKTCTLNGSYYIAASDAITQTPRWREDLGCFIFGDYPQNVSTISSYTTEPVYNGWYMGSDGYFYEKSDTWVAVQEGNGNLMTNGQRMVSGTNYYFRVLPIEWRYASSDYNGRQLLIARKNLDREQFYGSNDNRTINGETIYPVNYKYSKVRAFLNGKYESGDTQSQDYLDRGFLQKAFTKRAQDRIYEGAVDDCMDKIFVLSYWDATNTSFGFKEATWQNYGNRLIYATDYAKAHHVFQSRWTDGKYASVWWLRSISTNVNVHCVTTNATCNVTENVTSDHIGIVPALVLKDWW